LFFVGWAKNINLKKKCQIRLKRRDVFGLFLLDMGILVIPSRIVIISSGAQANLQIENRLRLNPVSFSLFFASLFIKNEKGIIIDRLILNLYYEESFSIKVY